MATACPTPAPFQPAHGDPETTLRRLEIWYQGMQTYLMFARRLNAQGQAVNYTEAEKMQLALMVGGENVTDILTYTGNQVVRGDEAMDSRQRAKPLSLPCKATSMKQRPFTLFKE